jgi:hypothetical protein
MLLPLTDLHETIAFLDPAGQRRPNETVKKVRSRAAIILIGTDWFDRVFTLLAWAKRASTDELVDTMIEINQQWKPQRWGCEANAMQELFGSMIQREARYKTIHFPIEPVWQPTKIDKIWRTRTRLNALYNEGRLFFQEHQVELQQEVKDFPRCATYDLIDALASACDMRRPVVTRADHDSELRALADYWRDSGAPPSYVADRLAELARESVYAQYTERTGGPSWATLADDIPTGNGTTSR